MVEREMICKGIAGRFSSGGTPNFKYYLNREDYIKDVSDWNTTPPEIGHLEIWAAVPIGQEKLLEMARTLNKYMVKAAK